MKRNANTSMKLGFALTGAAVIVIVSLVIHQHRPTPTQKTVYKPTTSYVIPKSTPQPVIRDEVVVKTPESTFPELTTIVDEFKEMDQEVKGDTFQQAFAKARALYGPGETFVWNGNEYSTNTADDLVKAPEDQGDNLRDESGSGFAEIRIESEEDSNLTYASPN